MPNHISNRMEFKALNEDNWRKETEAFEQVKVLMKTEQHPFDFNVLIPYPQEYKVLDDARHEAEKQPGAKWNELPKDGYNAGGYDWCIKHWGTKWNAYDIGFGYDDICFCTAWNTPLPIWAELSKRFPELYLEVEYADEDRGSNCGTLTYLNGELIGFMDMSERPEAHLFARAIIAEQQAAYYRAEADDAKHPANPPSAADDASTPNADTPAGDG